MQRIKLLQCKSNNQNKKQYEQEVELKCGARKETNPQCIAELIHTY
jgi:hypothetical protein